jgi:hypothetical protein
MFSQPYVSISRSSEEKEISHYDTIIKGPNNTPVFLYLNSFYSYFEVLDINTMKKTELSHPKVELAIGIDDEVFATASIHSIKLWRFDNLTLVNEYKIFNKETPWPYTNDGAARSLQLLPGKVLVAFVSTGYWQHTPEKVYSTLFALDLKTGMAINFDLSHFKQLMNYNIVAIPHKPNQFILYDHLHGEDFYIIAINWKKKCLNFIAEQQNLKEGAFYNIKISPDGQYWAIDMRYGCTLKPIFGIQVYKIDEHYKLTCIAKMFEADAPQWDGNKLLYFLEKRVCEFNPEDLSHTILTNQLSYNAMISPHFSDCYFQVANGNQWETYNKHPHFENYAKEWTAQVDLHTQLKLPLPLIKIIGEYVGLETISSKAENIKPIPLSKFGLLTLFKKPSESGLMDIQPQAKKQKLNPGIELKSSAKR